MSPFVRNGDVLTLSPLSEAEPRLGDIVGCIHPESGKLVVHRLIGRRGADWIIRGDNSPQADGLIPKNDILGRVIRIERGAKSVSFGMGIERSLIVVLSSQGWIWIVRSIYLFFRRAAGAMLRWMTGFRAYRALGRNLRPRIATQEASAADIQAPHTPDRAENSR